jgi:hypothetical protein
VRYCVTEQLEKLEPSLYKRDALRDRFAGHACIALGVLRTPQSPTRSVLLTVEWPVLAFSGTRGPRLAARLERIADEFQE